MGFGVPAESPRMQAGTVLQGIEGGSADPDAPAAPHWDAGRIQERSPDGWVFYWKEASPSGMPRSIECGGHGRDRADCSASKDPSVGFSRNDGGTISGC